MPLLEVRDLCSHYGDLQALFDLSLDVGEGEATALIDPAMHPRRRRALPRWEW